MIIKGRSVAYLNVMLYISLTKQYSMSKQPKAGRPPSGKERKEAITATLDTSVIEALNHEAEKEGKSRSGIINRILRKVLGIKD